MPLLALPTCRAGVFQSPIVYTSTTVSYYSLLSIQVILLCYFALRPIAIVGCIMHIQEVIDEKAAQVIFDQSPLIIHYLTDIRNSFAAACPSRGPA
jgi:hypothetical protein